MPSYAKVPTRGEGRESVRLSVTLPKVVHDALETMAAKQDVSLAWMVRKAAEKFVEDQNPLFARHLDGGGPASGSA